MNAHRINKTALPFFALIALAVSLSSCGNNTGNNKNHGQFELEAVDLGLSVKWANANLGATSPEDYGDYYAWGETETKKFYTEETYTYSGASSILPLSADVAHKKLGGNWHMPTASEVDELISTRQNASYKWEWKSINGHNGWEIVYLVNGNSIFIPAAGLRCRTLSYVGSHGYYWSSSLSTDDPDYAWHVEIGSGGVGRYNFYFSGRALGQSVRPVTE